MSAKLSIGFLKKFFKKIEKSIDTLADICYNVTVKKRRKTLKTGKGKKMTVKELMEMLSKMPSDAKVTFADTYQQNEGNDDEATLDVEIVTLVNGEVVLNEDIYKD